MTSERKEVVILDTHEGDIQVHVSGNTVYFDNNIMDATNVHFGISEEDWIVLRNFIDSELGLNNQ